MIQEWLLCRERASHGLKENCSSTELRDHNFDITCDQIISQFRSDRTYNYQTLTSKSTIFKRIAPYLQNTVY